MPNNVSESQLIEVWQHQLLDRTGLVTEGGEPIEIIYPGRINDNRGPDFRDAVIATGRGLIKGDIEVHVKSGGWQAHRHHRDEVYNRVIMHVVMWHNSKTATNLQNGRAVPILALHKYIKVPISRWSNLPCSPTTPNVPCLNVAQRLATVIIAGFLDKAGEERFLAKADKFKRDLSQMAASQSLYQGIMGALGYAKNKLSFLELAHRLPLQVLEMIAQGRMTDEEYLARQQALLLGTAGLLPSQRQDRHQENRLADGWINRLEKLWASSQHTGAMSLSAWNLFKVRPNNAPIRRLVAMSYLMLRYRERGIFEELLNMVKEAPDSRGYYGLETGLLVTASGYWVDHFDFGSWSRLASPTLLGNERAADIIVNVLLPFTFAWSQFSSQPELERKAFDLYRRYPRLVANSVERHMAKQLGLSCRLVNAAQRQQGLIHIYNHRCTQGRCDACSLSQLEAGHYIQI